MSDKTQMLVKTLLAMTRTNILTWRREEPPVNLVGPEEDVLDFVYTSTYNEHRFRTYEYRYKYYVDELNWNWSDDIALEIIDEQNRALWQFPKTPDTRSLFRTVQYQTANVDAILSDLLGPE